MSFPLRGHVSFFFLFFVLFFSLTAPPPASANSFPSGTGFILVMVLVGGGVVLAPTTALLSCVQLALLRPGEPGTRSRRILAWLLLLTGALSLIMALVSFPILGGSGQLERGAALAYRHALVFGLVALVVGAVSFGTTPLADSTVHKLRLAAMATAVIGVVLVNMPAVLSGVQQRSRLRYVTKTFRGPFQGIGGLAFTRDGTMLACAGHVSFTADRLSLWNVADGTKVDRTFEPHTARLSCLAISPDGTLVATGSEDTTIHLADLATGAARGAPLTGHEARVTGLAFTPGGRTLVSSGDDGTLRFWSLVDGTCFRTIPVTTTMQQSVAMHPQGDLVAVGGFGGSLTVWRVADGTSVATVDAAKGNVLSLAFDAAGDLLAAGSGDGSVRLWRTADWSLVRTLVGHQAPCATVTFSPDGMLLASGSMDSSIRLWRPADGAPLTTLATLADDALANKWIESVAFSPDGSLLAAGVSSSGENVLLFDLADVPGLR